MTKTGTQRSVRTRRSGDEIRARMLSAARADFAELGFTGATTKHIASRAEVGEVLLFRHFGSKSGLFEEAVLAPFETFVDDWFRRWDQHGLIGDSVFELGRAYIEMLYSFFDDNRDLVVALLSAQPHQPVAAERLQAMFDRLAHTVRESSSEYGFTIRDPITTVRLTFGMVLSTVEHADLLFTPGDRPSREEIIDRLTRYMLYGVVHSDESPE